MKQRALIIILPWIIQIPISAQTDTFKDQYENFRKEILGNYQSFRQQANKKYVEWMKYAWERYKALPKIENPKDNDLPPITIDEDRLHEPIESKPIQSDIIPTPKIPTQPHPVEPIIEIPQSKLTTSKFHFYGLNCIIRFDEELKFNLNSLSNEEIAQTWELLSSDKLNNTINDCLNYRNSANFCDWAYIQFLDKFASSCFNHENEKNLLMAFLLCQSGYKIRLAKTHTALYFLYASSHYLFDITPFQIGDELYYGYNCPASEVEIFNASFPHEQSFSFWITKEMIMGYRPSNNRIITSKRYPDVKLSTKVNQNLIDFFSTYPASATDNNFMTKWAMYANTPLSADVKKELYPQLKNLIAEKSQFEATNIILNTIQTGFEYELDDKVWGHDRAFFAEESLYYPYCDCEDRSILFSRIVRDLLHLDVILVFYPGHLATAVAFTENVTGDYITIDNRKYVICDPTYIGAPIGLTMPNMDNKTAKVILLRR